MVSCLLWVRSLLGTNWVKNHTHTQGFRVKHVYSRLSLSYKRGRVRSLLLTRLLIFYTSIH